MLPHGDKGRLAAEISDQTMLVWPAVVHFHRGDDSHQMAQKSRLIGIGAERSDSPDSDCWREAEEQSRDDGEQPTKLSCAFKRKALCQPQHSSRFASVSQSPLLFKMLSRAVVRPAAWAGAATAALRYEVAMPCPSRNTHRTPYINRLAIVKDPW